MERQRSIIVEFVGIAGVGKTTLCNEVGRVLGEEYSCVINPNEEISISLVTRAKIIFNAISLIASQFKVSSKNFFRLVNMLYLAQLKNYYASRPGIHLIDQGIYQGILFSIFPRKKDFDHIGFSKSILSLLEKKIDLVVYVNASPEVVKMRRINRGGKKKKTTDISFIKQQIIDSKVNMSSLIETLKRTTGTCFVEVTNETEDNFRDVVKVIVETIGTLHLG